MAELRRVCVYCGSSAGEDPEYLGAAEALGAELVSEGLELVYGGARIGLMGRLADEVLAREGRVTGIMPRALVDREVVHRGLSRLEVVDSMHARKARMEALSDAFVALPGGLGTLEELLETLTWAQLGLHRKPCGILNAGGYFDLLVRFLDRAVREGFVGTASRRMLIVEKDPSKLLSRLRSYEPPPVPRWIDEDES